MLQYPVYYGAFPFISRNTCSSSDRQKALAQYTVLNAIQPQRHPHEISMSVLII